MYCFIYYKEVGHGDSHRREETWAGGQKMPDSNHDIELPRFSRRIDRVGSSSADPDRPRRGPGVLSPFSGVLNGGVAPRDGPYPTLSHLTLHPLVVGHLSAGRAGDADDTGASGRVSRTVDTDRPRRTAGAGPPRRAGPDREGRTNETSLADLVGGDESDTVERGSAPPRTRGFESGVDTGFTASASGPADGASTDSDVSGRAFQTRATEGRTPERDLPERRVAEASDSDASVPDPETGRPERAPSVDRTRGRSPTSTGRDGASAPTETPALVVRRESVDGGGDSAVAGGRASPGETDRPEASSGDPTRSRPRDAMATGDGRDGAGRKVPSTDGTRSRSLSEALDADPDADRFVDRLYEQMRRKRRTERERRGL